VSICDVFFIPFFRDPIRSRATTQCCNTFFFNPLFVMTVVLQMGMQVVVRLFKVAVIGELAASSPHLIFQFEGRHNFLSSTGLSATGIFDMWLCAWCRPGSRTRCFPSIRRMLLATLMVFMNQTVLCPMAFLTTFFGRVDIMTVPGSPFGLRSFSPVGVEVKLRLRDDILPDLYPSLPPSLVFASWRSCPSPPVSASARFSKPQPYGPPLYSSRLPFHPLCSLFPVFLWVQKVIFLKHFWFFPYSGRRLSLLFGTNLWSVIRGSHSPRPP